jgi:FKBP-type peptidyl-prolyl cis-trans isomerase FklB
MRQLFGFIICLAVIIQFSQCRTPAAIKAEPVDVVVKDTVPVAPGLKDQLDSFSYAVGMSVALQYKEFGVVTLNSNVCLSAVNDIINDKQPAFTPDQANYVLNSYINKLMAEKAGKNKHAGDSFLAVNRTRPNVKTLQSGLQYIVVKEGSGAMPKSTDTVTVHYTGTLMDGTVFDSSVDRGEPAKFTVDGVIRGWTEALQLMKAGSRWKLFIPADLAYGSYSPPGSNIPPGSILIFDLELISVGQ